MNKIRIDNDNGDFQKAKLFQKKFREAGFKVPAKQYSANDIYTDKVFWKDPKELY